MNKPTEDSDVERLLARRRRSLGAAYRLFYDRPLHLVRGEGVWLYDSQGRAYLDVYNNVAHVGHCHPHVTEALARQANTLNTHTRYLHEAVLDYAERLAALFPGELGVCMFTCSGSEADELALRIAKTVTGGEGMIVTQHAYHGNTSALTELSPTHAYARRGPHVKTCPPPDTFRGPHRTGESGLGRKYAAHVGESLDELHQQGIRPAALLADTIFSSDGIFTAPADYFPEAIARVRAAGGLFIADEVQPGFGRTGDHHWGFQRYGIVPDIVTLGKPAGGGHPLGVVVSTPQLMNQFAAAARYFNTFGGNPVSSAVGLAVLDVLEQQQLQENARVVGTHLKQELTRLQSKHELIGDVRGHGLYLGVELVRNRQTLEPATAEATQVVNGLRDRGVLIGTTGRHDNVLKLRPPMVFSQENARQLIDALDAVLAAI